MVSHVFFSFFSHFIYKRSSLPIQEFSGKAKDSAKLNSNLLNTSKIPLNLLKLSINDLNSKRKVSPSLEDSKLATPSLFDSKNFDPNGFVTAYKRRNIFRLFFLFFKGGILKTHQLLIQVHEFFGRPTDSPKLKLLAIFGRFEYAKNVETLNSATSSKFPIRQYFGSTKSKTWFFRAPVFFRKFSRLESTKWIVLFQILLIPYIVIFGFFFTFTSLNFSFFETNFEPRNRPKFFSGFSANSLIHRLNSKTNSSLYPDFGKKKLVDSTTKLKGFLEGSSGGQDQFEMHSYKIHSFGRFGGIESLSFEFLRFTNYSSKIFVLWGFLNIWRGIRPAQSTRNEYVIQTRYVTKRKNSKRFTDVEGIEKFLPILETLVESLQRNFFQISFSIALRKSNQKNFNASSMKLNKAFPKGYLFIGPPGTGKTLLAQAVAGESGVTLICLSASEIQKQIDIGTRIGAIRLRNLFQQARKNTPCILFLDEIDSIGKVQPASPVNALSNNDSSQYNEAENNSKYKEIRLDSLFRFGSAYIDPMSNTFKILGDTEKPSTEMSDNTKLLKRGLTEKKSEYTKNQIFGSQQIDFNSRSRIQIRSQELLSPDYSQNSLDQFALKQIDNLGGGAEANAAELRSNTLGSRSSDITLLTEFLIQMDSFSAQDGFLVIGTTNFLGNLDSAFIRSGRFDRIIGLQFPGNQTRIALLKLYAKKQGFDESIVWNSFVEKTKGFSAADLAKVINESSLYLIENFIKKSSLNSEVHQKKNSLYHTSESLQKGIEKISSREKFVK